MNTQIDYSSLTLSQIEELVNKPFSSEIDYFQIFNALNRIKEGKDVEVFN